MVHVTISNDDPVRAGDDRRSREGVTFDLDAPFNKVVDALMPHRDVPGPGFVAQARRIVQERTDYLEKHGALTAEQVAELTGSSAANRRQTATRWAAKRAIFGVEHHGRTLYPAFQFDVDTQRPRPQIRATLERLPAQLSGWALAFWWDTPLVDGDRWVVPLDVLDDPEQLARLATIETAGWQADGAA